MKKIFITGVGTGVGKTIVSAIVTEALSADYWKPVQTGSIEGTDSQLIRKLVKHGGKIHPEAYCLGKPVSPHEAAQEENIRIQIRDIKVPDTTNNLVIEGAGGLMVPLNDKELMIDLIKALDANVIVVVRHYLGSINHTLLSLKMLHEYGIPLSGLIYNGDPNPASEEAISNFGNCAVLGRVGEEKEFTPSTIEHYARELKPALKNILV